MTIIQESPDTKSRIYRWNELCYEVFENIKIYIEWMENAISARTLKQRRMQISWVSSPK